MNSQSILLSKPVTKAISTEGATTADIMAIRVQMKHFICAEKAVFYPRFFKTGPGQYGEGDHFMGIVVPDIRRCACKFEQASSAVLVELLDSKFHEERMLALIIMVMRYRKCNPQQRQLIHNLYLEKMERVNNWDLVDISAPTIVGSHLYSTSRKLLYQWTQSDNLWRRRIAIVATMYFIRQEDLQDTFGIAECLLHDPHDLIHKAVGWMLREAGKINQLTLEEFLNKHAHNMPRTMLRYSIEKFTQAKRQIYMNIKTDPKKY